MITDARGGGGFPSRNTFWLAKSSIELLLLTKSRGIFFNFLNRQGKGDEKLWQRYQHTMEQQ